LSNRRKAKWRARRCAVTFGLPTRKPTRKSCRKFVKQTAEQIRAAQAHATDEISQFRSSYATKLRFDYALDAKSSREPFLVSAIYHDDNFTYIRCAAREKPAFYEIKDGNQTSFLSNLKTVCMSFRRLSTAGISLSGRRS